jgi:predicted RNA-binding Zn-ribbon protein involved in translation (DUF1610 family)
MTKIRARCPRCGDVEFGTSSIVVLSEGPATNAYRFNCPECGDTVSRSAVPDVLALLVSAGVREEASAPTVDLVAALTPALTEHDVASFRDLLDSEFVWDRLQSVMQTED